MSYQETEKVAGMPIDHSFPSYLKVPEKVKKQSVETLKVIIPQAYYITLKKQGLSFMDIKRICDAMDAELCIEIKKKEKPIKVTAEKQAIEAQIAELQVKLKNL